MNGWFKCWREMWGHAVWSLPPSQRCVWLTCLRLANIKAASWFDGKEQVEIPAGSFISSQEHIATLARVGRQVVRDALRNLERIGSIRTQTRTKRWTLITVENWPRYNGEDLEANQGENQPGTQREPRGNHNGRRKELNTPASDVALAGVGSVAPGSTKRQPAKPTDPNVGVVIDAYHAAFREKYGSPPPLNGGKCGAIAKQLLQGRPVTEAVWLVREFLQSPPQFYADKNLCGMEHVLTAAPTLLARKANEGSGA